MRVYTPRELGLPFPEVKFIYAGNCPADKAHRYEWPNAEITKDYCVAHTHKCPGDPIFNCICVLRDDYFFNSDGTITDMIWHEYGHVLDNRLPNLIVRCGSTQLEHKLKTEWDGHDEYWQNIMVSLGQNHIDSPWVDPKY